VLAEEVGLMLRLTADNLRQLLNARRQAKNIARTMNQTTVEALDNNPLKFSPTTEDALRIMFGPRTRSYLDARQALEQSFADVKAHQLNTFSAMQHALRRLVADLDPKSIEADTGADRGLAAVVGSRKARLWDVYAARWQAKVRERDGGLVDAFMDYFAEYYDDAGKGLR
jgi:type VI secretion system protein ImpI